MQPRKHKKNLPCILSPDEKADYSQALVELMQEGDELAAKKKQLADVFKRKIDGNKDSQDTVAEKLRSGMEDRLVDCETRYFQPDDSSKQVVRLDTGDVIETLPLTEDERQLTMFQPTDTDTDFDDEEEEDEELFEDNNNETQTEEEF